MMQSLLTGVVNAKNNDLKAHKENEKRESNTDSLQKDKVAQEQQRFSKVLQQNLEQDKVAADKKTSSKESITSEQDTIENETISNRKVLVNEKLSSTEQALAADISDKSSELNNEISAASILDASLQVDLAIAPPQVSDGSAVVNESEEGDSSTSSLQQDLAIQAETAAISESFSQSNEQSSLATQITTDSLNNSANQSNDIKQQQLLSEIETDTDSLNDPTSQSNEAQQDQLLLAIQAAQQVNTNVTNGSEQLVEGVVSPFSLSEVTNNVSAELTTQATTDNNNNVEEVASLSTESTINNSEEVVALPINSVNKAAVDVDQSNTKTLQEKSVDSLLSTNQSNNKNTNESHKEKMMVSVDSQDLSLKTNTVNIGTANVVADNSESLSEASLLRLKVSDESDSLPFTLKNEGVAAAPGVVDVNGAKPNQTSFAQLDKLIAGNQQQQATNNLLQQPLDLQSKQAAAMMGERVMMMISQGKQEVQIRLDPAELGSMFIKVQVQQDQVQLNIQTQAGLSKDLIEQNMPRLREQLAQQGIQLGEANVQQQSQQQRQQQRSNEVNTMSGQGSNGLEMAEEEQTAAWIPSKIAPTDQGIDYYA